jgi:3-isopropylmalate dehydrogenase
MNEAEFRIAVMPGDGIGIEVMDVCQEVLEIVQRRVGGFRLRNETLDAGVGAYQRTGTPLSDETIRAAGAADAILLGAMGMPDVRLPDGREIAPQIDLRNEFELYAGVRPIRPLPGLPSILADPRAAEINLVILRESTEGLFKERHHGVVEGEEQASDRMVITRRISEKLFDFAFKLAERRRGRGGKGRVDCIDKANVFRSMAFFRKIFFERARAFPHLEADARYIDATALDLIRKPWAFDVLVTENMFGDILSDEAAALVGGMGMAPSADIGDEKAVFQPSHGTAPDIMGQGIANPTAMLLSAAMMLDWLGDKHEVEAATTAGLLLERAVDEAFGSGLVKPYEFGGRSGTRDIARAVADLARTIDLDRLRG